MDWLLRPLIFLGLFSCIVDGRKCGLDECSSIYREAMEKARILRQERSPQFCEILQSYRQCLNKTKSSCRGELTFHSSEYVTGRMEQDYCPHSNDRSGPSPNKGSPIKPVPRGSVPTAHSPRPSCKYFGNHKYRFCSLFGDPHLKTFNGMYQTCRINGTWPLINNSYISVHVTSRPVVENSAVTAPTKITVVVKSSSTPCTLEKRYSADSQYSLPSTFDDGTDRPGADETVSLHFRNNSEYHGETVTIEVKYIATQLVIRRVGLYLAFSARLPLELFGDKGGGGSGGDQAAAEELCSSGCPDAEQLDITAAHDYVMSREQALAECNATEQLSAELRNRLTDNYLDWCMFDLMTSGTVYDFVAVAHAAQALALKEDPHSLMNRTEPIDLISAQHKSKASTMTLLQSSQLPVIVASLVSSLCRFLL